MSFLTGHQVTLGPVTLATPVFLMLLAALVGILLVSLRFRADKERRRLFFDRLSTAALLVLLGWKVFPLFYSFGEMITRPMTLLYTPGGTPGLIFGFALAALYFGFKIFKGKRQQTAERHLLSPLLVFGIGFVGVSALLLTTSSVLRAQQAAKPAPTFSATTMAGKPVALDDLKGKTIILNFWATWCPPCRAEIPTLSTFHDEQKDGDTVLIGIAVGPTQTAGAVGQFMEQAEITYPVILDSNRSIASSYGVRTLPTSVVISPGGSIAESRVGAIDRYWLRSHISR